MADTALTRPALIASFPDNSVGTISPQAARNLVMSVVLTIGTPGGQTIYGSNQTGDSLTLVGNNVDGMALGGGLIKFGLQGDAIFDGSGFIAATTPHIIQVRHGTAADPVTVTGPTVRIDRTGSTTSAVPTLGDYCAGLFVAAKAIGGDDQAMAISGSALTVITKDAVGVQGIGVTWTSTGNSFGGYFGGFTFGTGYAHGIELRTYNYSGSDHVFAATENNPTSGIVILADGNHKSAVGIVVGKGDGAVAWKVGAYFASSIDTATIRDDTSSTTSIDINGSHSVGLDMAGATITSIGAIIRGNNGIPIMDLRTITAGHQGLINFSDATTAKWQVGKNGDNSFMIYDVVQADFPFSISAAGYVNIVAGGRRLGFYGATAVAKQTGVAVSSAGIHAALVNLGLIAA